MVKRFRRENSNTHIKRRAFSSTSDSELRHIPLLRNSVSEYGLPKSDISTQSNPTKHFRAWNSVELSDSQETIEKPTRSRWTVEETELLIRGCHEYGVGAWKKILKDPKYSFPSRTTVDLKDRFRTVFPQQYKLLYSIRGKSAFSTFNPYFRRIQRRPRKKFTKEDDYNLLLGVEKYGCSWSRIAKDPELKLCDRYSMDLRDRFRIAFPESYAKFGYAPRVVQQTPRLISRNRRVEICSELVREESREFLSSHHQLSEDSFSSGTHDVEDARITACTSDITGTSEEGLDSNDVTGFPLNTVSFSNSSSNQLGWDKFNNRTEIMSSTPLRGVKLNGCSVTQVVPQDSNSRIDRGKTTPHSVGHIPMRKYHLKRRSNKERIPKSPWLVRNIRDTVQHSPVKRVFTREYTAQPDPDSELQTDICALHSGRKQQQYTPIRVLPRDRACHQQATNQASQDIPISKSSSMTSTPTNYSPVDSEIYSKDQISASVRDTLANTTIQSYVSESRQCIAQVSITQVDDEILDMKANRQDINCESNDTSQAQSTRLSPVYENPLPVVSITHSPRLDGDYITRRVSTGLHRGSSVMTIRYSPIRRVHQELPKIAQPASISPLLPSRQLPLTSADLLNTYHESFKQPQLTHSLNSINANEGGDPQLNGSESEVLSVPELTDQTNEGSDYESSDFIDSITPNLEVANYSSLNISTASTNKTPNTCDKSHALIIRSPTHTSTPNHPPNSTNQVQLAGSTNSTIDTGINLAISSPLPSSLQGKIVGARIRNGEVEYKFKFRSIWKSANETENQSELIQNFMNTLTSRTSFLSLISNDSNTTIHE